MTHQGIELIDLKERFLKEHPDDNTLFIIRPKDAKEFSDFMLFFLNKLDFINDIKHDFGIKKFIMARPHIKEYIFVTAKNDEFLTPMRMSIITPFEIYLKRNNINFEL